MSHEWLYEWSNRIMPLFGNHLWQATLFAILVSAVAMAINRAPARVRYAVWLLAYMQFILPSAFLIYLSSRVLDIKFFIDPIESSASNVNLITQISESIAEPFETVNVSLNSTQSGSAQFGHSEIFCVLTALWVTGCVIMLVRYWKRRQQFARALRNGSEIKNERITNALMRAQRQLNTKRKIRLILSQEALEPGVWRSWNSVLVLNKDIAKEWSEDELDAVLLHEVAHVSRWDNFVSNFQMLVRCVLWFHPLIWFLDKRLLVEREYACDEKVLELGVAPKVYASSLLKAVRFCLGHNVAGMSSLAGSNLQRRIKIIMANRTNKSVLKKHWVSVGALAAIILFLSLATGIFSNTGVSAQTNKIQEVEFDREGQRQPSLDSSITPRPKGAQLENESLMQADQAPFYTARFENQAGAPVSITDAKVRLVPFVKKDVGDDKVLLIHPKLTIVNNTNQRITGLGISLKVKDVTHDTIFGQVVIEPNASVVMQIHKQKWSVIAPIDEARLLVVSLVGVKFDDGSMWGKIAANNSSSEDTPTPPPFAPKEKKTEDVPEPSAQLQESLDVNYVSAKFQNPEGSPVVITQAKTRTILSKDAIAELPFNDTKDVVHLPVVMLKNTTNRKVVSLKLRFKADTPSHAVTAFRVSIEPFGSYIFNRSQKTMSGMAENMTVQLLGVVFEDGSTWGVMDSMINAGQAWITVPNYIH